MLYKDFYRRYGVRKVQNLMSPVFLNLDSLPKSSLLHVLEYHDLDVSKQYYNKPVLVDFVSKLEQTKGNPNTKAYNIRANVKNLLRANSNVRFLAVDNKRITETILTVFCYDYLDKCYTYVGSAPLIEYYRINNKQFTLTETINTSCNGTALNNFMIVNLPKDIASFKLFNIFSRKINTSIMKLFGTPENLMLLEIWKWLDLETRSMSVFNQITTENLGKVNILFVNRDNKTSVVNLGILNSFIKQDDAVGGFDSKVIQKLFLKYLMMLQSTVEVPEVETDDTSEIVEDVEIHDDIDTYITNIDGEIADHDAASSERLASMNIYLNNSDEVIEAPVDDTPVYVDPYQSISAKDAISNKLNTVLANGSITAADHKSISKDVSRYGELKDPYGSDKLLKDMLDITKDELRIDASASEIVASDAVLDKSMLSSSLLSYDSDYMTKVFNKDVLNAVNSMQKMGIIIKNHRIDRDTSILGSVDIHSIEIKPIEGMASTIKLRLPVIDKNGVWSVAGNNYTCRKQRVDLPIRKISPTSVALSSYYNKLFIKTATKKAQSSVAWICNQINKAILNQSTYITKVKTGDYLDKSFKAPYIYNALSAEYGSMTVGSYDLSFNKEALRKNLPDGFVLTDLEVDGSILVGISKLNEPILVNKRDIFYIKGDTDTILGDIYSLLKLPRNKAPIDFSEIKIFSKVIPIAIALGYLLGIENLLKALGVTYELSQGSFSDEYSLVFKDRTLYFDGTDKKSRMLLAGFYQFESELANNEFKMFNNKDIYFSMFKKAGLTFMHIKEIELLDVLFIDHITESILRDMNEPVTFRGLLIRANELLTTYDSPDSQDMLEMRIRGYERLPGMIYKELITSIREFNNKSIKARSKIEISPYQVWSAFMKDPSVDLVKSINPIQDLKEIESVTYAGSGGRSKDGMSKATRAFSGNDIGVISESTVDSSDVGVNIYLSPNPNFKNLRGLTFAESDTAATKRVSTSSLMAVASDSDDLKRVFIASMYNIYYTLMKTYL